MKVTKKQTKKPKKPSVPHAKRGIKKGTKRHGMLVRKKLPGFKTRRVDSGAKVVAKSAKNPLEDAISPEKFDIPSVWDSSRPYSEDDPPDFLNVDGIYMWKLVGRAIAKVGELNNDHLPGLVSLCYLHQRMRHRMKLQLDIPASDFMSYNRYLNAYGLTPLAGQALDPENKRRVNPTPFVPPVPEDTPNDSFKSLRGEAREV